MMYGAGGAGLRCMTFTSSPGFSLMLEGMSYMIGAEVPAVFVNVMRGGPGLGNIGPAQADIKLACRGLGHGNTHAIVLVPATPQEMLDDAMLSFELAFEYRNPVVILGDGYLGQMTGQVRLPDRMVVPGIPEWAVYGDRSHRGNLICSIELSELDLERHDQALDEKYAPMAAAEQRADLHHCDDADVVLVACNTPAQLAKGAVKELRDHGPPGRAVPPDHAVAVPDRRAARGVDRARHIVVVEARAGQLEDEVRLALSHAEVHAPPISHVRRQGGVLPSQAEIVDHVLRPGGGALMPSSVFYRQFDRHDHATGLKAHATTYCPGCGHGLATSTSPRRSTSSASRTARSLVSPVGCSVFAYYYFDVGNTQAAHGRAPAVAIGHKTANPDSIVVSYQGDGDLASIGWPRSSAPPSWASR